MKGKAFDQEDWVERAVHQRAGPEPTDDLRSRVLDDVRRALAQPVAPAVRRSTGTARWAAVAAVLIVGLALSQMAASVTPFFDRPVPRSTTANVRATADLMRQVSPGLTADEANRLALASASRGDLPTIPIAKSNNGP